MRIAMERICYGGRICHGGDEDLLSEMRICHMRIC
jgi:hypothetical protein